MIVIADTHFGRNNDVVVDESTSLSNRMRDTLIRLREAVSVLVEMGEDTLVIAGDVFDTPRPKPSVQAAFNDFLLYCKGKCEVIIIPGNHDVDFSENALSETISAGFAHVRVILLPEVREVSGLKVLFIPHVSNRYLSGYDSAQGYVNQALALPGWQGVIGHAHVIGVKNSSDTEIEIGNAMPFSPSGLAGKVGIFGHIHDAQLSGEKAGFSYHYPGSPIPCNYGEVMSARGYLHWSAACPMPQFYPYTSKVLEYDHIIIDLISKDEPNYDREKAQARCGGKLLKITVYTDNMLKVDERKLRDFFNKYGKVTRFETIYRESEREVLDISFDDLKPRESYPELFAKWLEARECAPEAIEAAVSRLVEIMAQVGVRL